MMLKKRTKCHVLICNEGSAEEYIEFLDEKLYVYKSREGAVRDAENWSSDNVQYTVRHATIVLEDVDGQ